VSQHRVHNFQVPGQQSGLDFAIYSIFALGGSPRSRYQSVGGSAHGREDDYSLGRAYGLMVSNMVRSSLLFDDDVGDFAK
jgi:hypothetical protein